MSDSHKNAKARAVAVLGATMGPGMAPDEDLAALFRGSSGG